MSITNKVHVLFDLCVNIAHYIKIGCFFKRKIIKVSQKKTKQFIFSSNTCGHSCLQSTVNPIYLTAW